MSLHQLLQKHMTKWQENGTGLAVIGKVLQLLSSKRHDSITRENESSEGAKGHLARHDTSAGNTPHPHARPNSSQPHAALLVDTSQMSSAGQGELVDEVWERYLNSTPSPMPRAAPFSVQAGRGLQGGQSGSSSGEWKESPFQHHLRDRSHQHQHQNNTPGRGSGTVHGVFSSSPASPFPPRPMSKYPESQKLLMQQSAYLAQMLEGGKKSTSKGILGNPFIGPDAAATSTSSFQSPYPNPFSSSGLTSGNLSASGKSRQGSLSQSFHSSMQAVSSQGPASSLSGTVSGGLAGSTVSLPSGISNTNVSSLASSTSSSNIMSMKDVDDVPTVVDKIHKARPCTILEMQSFQNEEMKEMQTEVAGSADHLSASQSGERKIIDGVDLEDLGLGSRTNRVSDSSDPYSLHQRFSSPFVGNRKWSSSRSSGSGGGSAGAGSSYSDLNASVSKKGSLDSVPISGHLRLELKPFQKVLPFFCISCLNP